MSDLPPLASVTVVGAGVAGYATARALRHQGFDGTLTVVGAERHRPYDRPPLSKAYLAGTAEVSDLVLEAEGEELDVRWRLGRTAVALDPGTHTVTLDDDTIIRTDAVVVASGSIARRLPGAVPRGVHTLRTLDDATALRADLLPGARLVVVGAGFVGAEVAATASGLGLEVTVVEALTTPLAAAVGPLLGVAVAGLHERRGVRLLLGVGVEQLEGADRVTGVRLADGRLLPADVVVVGVGAAPALDWLGRTGLPVAGGLHCDSSGGTDAERVVGVGDGAAWWDPATGTHRRVEHWTDSRDRPAHAVAALLHGRALGPPPRAPYFWSDQYGVRIQFAGVRTGDEDVDVVEGALETEDLLAVYRRDGRPVAVLGLDQPRAFTRWRRQLSAAPSEALAL